MNCFNKRKVEKAEEILEQDKVRKKHKCMRNIKNVVKGIFFLIIVVLAIAAIVAPDEDEI